MVIALGEQYTGVFTNSDSLWSELDRAGKAEHDEVWRMPLSEGYLGQIGGSNADLINTGGRAAGVCLRSFLPIPPFISFFSPLTLTDSS